MSVNLKTRGSHLHFGSDSFEILQKIFSIFPSQCFPPYLSLCSCSVGQNVFIPYIEAICLVGFTVLGSHINSWVERDTVIRVSCPVNTKTRNCTSLHPILRKDNNTLNLAVPIMKSEFSLLRSRQF